MGGIEISGLEIEGVWTINFLVGAQLGGWGLGIGGPGGRLLEEQ